MPEVHLRPLKLSLTAPSHRLTPCVHAHTHRLGTMLPSIPRTFFQSLFIFHFHFLFLFLSLFLGIFIFASTPARAHARHYDVANSADSSSGLRTSDSLQGVSARVPMRSSGGVDTVVTYKAKDSVVFSLRSKKMRLRGSAETALRARVLQSEVIEIFFDSGLLNSTGAKDSAGNMIGYPVFNDNGSSYAGEVIKYNLRNQLGTVSLGETTIQ
ncbi:MAG: hypothetical protein RL156_1191, partial [Bacteroidota bacterium]